MHVCWNTVDGAQYLSKGACRYTALPNKKCKEEIKYEE